MSHHEQVWDTTHLANDLKEGEKESTGKYKAPSPGHLVTKQVLQVHTKDILDELVSIQHSLKSKLFTDSSIQ